MAKRDILRNKKASGRGIRTGCGNKSHSNTHQLRKVINYLKLCGEDCMTNIARNTMIKSYYVKDALLFLCSIDVIEKIVVSSKISRSDYYRLKQKKEV